MGLGRSHLPELTDVSRVNFQHAAEPLQFAVMEAKNFGSLISLTVSHINMLSLKYALITMVQNIS